MQLSLLLTALAPITPVGVLANELKSLLLLLPV